MFTKTDLQNLREYREENGRVLSVYLDLDQSNAANLNRGFEAALDSKLRSIESKLTDESELRDFEYCAGVVRNVVLKHQTQSRALVIFVRVNGSVWMKALDAPVVTEARWAEAPCVQRFIETLDEFESYAVLLADKARARIFTTDMGSIVEHTDVRSFTPVRHIKTTGTDHLYSQDHFQRKADEHVSLHFKRVVQALETISKTHPFQRLILSGSNEATSEICRFLSKRLRRKVIATVTLPINTPPKDVLEHTLQVERDAERAFELGRTEALITAAAKGSRAVTGLEKTIDALSGKRVRQLVYADGLRPDLVENAISAALEEGASIEHVRGEAAEQLKTVGGIGAFLRF